MRNPFQEFSYGNLDSKFLPYFTLQAGGKALAGLAFSTRELPEAAQMRACVTLRNEQFVIPKNQSGRNFHWRAALR